MPGQMQRQIMVELRRRFVPLGLGLVQAVFLSSALATGSIPPAPAHYFNDGAGFVAPEAAAAMDQRLADLDRRTSTQVVVAVFPTLPEPSLEDFTARTAQAWRVGNKKLDSGLVLFVFVKEHKLRIEVGYGLEDKVPDAIAKRIIDEVIVPRLKAGQPSAGLEAGVDALIAAVQGQPVDAAPKPPAGAETDVALPPIPPEPPKQMPLKDAAQLFVLEVMAALVVLLSVLALPLRFSPIRRRMAAGQGFFGAWGSEALWLIFAVLRSTGSSGGTTYSSGSWGGGSSSSGGFSGGGGSFGGGGASGSW
jgi:uncharacterized protein